MSTTTTTIDASGSSQAHWLERYYFIRASFSIAWVAAAFAAGVGNPAIAGLLLLLVYPAWDAAANWVDGRRSGGLANNRTQLLNAWASGLTTLAVAAAWSSGMGAVIAVIGAWAVVSGLLQLGSAARRWRTQGAQWAMILSGAQSALAGAFFIAQSRMDPPPSIANIAGYAGVGALYFLISGVWLAVARMRGGPRAA